MTVGLKVEGIDELRRAIRKASDEGMKKALVAANKDLAKAIIDKALLKAPVRTGALKESVRGLGNASGAVGKAGGAKVPYAAAIHWGRKSRGLVRGRPFLHDAAKAIERDVEDAYLAEIDRILRTISDH